MIDPTIEFGVAAGALFISILCSVTVIAGRRRMRSILDLSESLERQVSVAETELVKLREAANISAERLSEQARHIAWLESRVKSAPIPDEVTEEPVPATARLSMTERRHRVSALASRGQNVESIASSLSMLPGEVELIIGLQRASMQIR